MTRDQRELAAESVGDSEELRRRLHEGVQVVGIDEAQFFDLGLADLVTELADRGIRVIVAGLDQDYRRQPFGPMPAILGLAEYVDKMHAVCVRCGGPAHYSQRIAGVALQSAFDTEQAFDHDLYLGFVGGAGAGYRLFDFTRGVFVDRQMVAKAGAQCRRAGMPEL